MYVFIIERQVMKKKVTKENENKPMSFRATPALRKNIIASAKKNTRNSAGEIIHRLMESFEKETK